MLKIKNWVKEFFGFSRSQVNGFVILLPLTTILLFSEPAWHWWKSSRNPDLTSDLARLDSLVIAWNTATRTTAPDSAVQEEKRSYFSFDPNTLRETDLLSLGISEKVANRIANYRRKGGKFRIKSDLLKIYGFDSALYRGLISFIRLPDKPKDIPKAKKPVDVRPFLAASKKENVIEKFDLNRADTAQLKKIYGVGAKLSLRIVKYRDKLGGFLDKMQLKEVYGLDSATISQIAEKSFLEAEVKKININTSDEKQLAAHPYFSKIAKSMVAYRYQHGEFKAVEDIRKVGTLDENTIQKVIPYLKVSEEK